MKSATRKESESTNHSALSRRPSRAAYTFLIVAMGFLHLCWGCRGKGAAGTGAAMPLGDGQYLVYAVSLDALGRHVDDSYRYEFKSLDHAQWQVTGSSGEYHTGPGDSYTMDKTATILTQAGSEFSKWKVGRRFNDLWLAPDDRQAGKMIRPLNDPGDHQVGPQTVWEKWQVVPATDRVEASFVETRYYEATTGWLVGIETSSNDGSKRIDVLRETNVAIPEK